MTIEKETLDFLNTSNRQFPDQHSKWLLRVLQNERASAASMRIVLDEALSHLDALGVEKRKRR